MSESTRMNWCAFCFLSMEFFFALCFREKSIFFFFVHHSNGKLDCSRMNLHQIQNQNKKKLFHIHLLLWFCIFFSVFIARCTMLSALYQHNEAAEQRTFSHRETTKVCRSIFAYYFMVSVESKMEMGTWGGNCSKIENIETVIWRLMWTNHVFSNRTHRRTLKALRQIGRQLSSFNMYEFELLLQQQHYNIIIGTSMATNQPNKTTKKIVFTSSSRNPNVKCYQIKYVGT